MGISTQDIIELNDLVLQASGGFGPGVVINQGTLDSCVDRYNYPAQQIPYLGSLFPRIASLLLCLVLFHPFADGNKRTGIQTAITLLSQSGYALDYDDDEAVTFILEVAQGMIGVEEITNWLRVHSQRIAF